LIGMLLRSALIAPWRVASSSGWVNLGSGKAHAYLPFPGARPL
jgi:hypothetical protein